MADRRAIYLGILAGCLVFYWAYREWLSWFLLVGLLALPWFSLLLSLPAMLKCRMEVQCLPTVSRGQQAALTYMGRCTLPIPGIKGKLLVTSSFGSGQLRLQSGDDLPTAHCGTLTITPGRTWVYDYLGLLRLPVRKKTGGKVLVWPVPVVDTPPDLSRYLVNAWKPKPGGGFAENHELRLYRPGDNLRQIHWKLSAKTAKLIVREPMQPLKGMALLTLKLSGTPAELDEKLGKLLYMSRYLLSRDVPHHIHCLTGSGVEMFRIDGETGLHQAIDTLLQAPLAPAGQTLTNSGASWHHHIGGDGYEG